MSMVITGDQPIQLQCPHCHAMVETAVRTECGMAAIVCILIGLFFLPIMYVACCMMDAVHVCPSCHMVIGCYKRC